MNKIILGIMVCPLKKGLFHEKGFYQFLQQYGQKHHVTVYVFYPDHVDWKKNLVKAFQYHTKHKKWVIKQLPLPQFIYDRCFYSSSKTYRTYKPYIEKLRQRKEIQFLGVGLKGKWEVYQILLKSEILKKHLPQTERYTNKKQMIKWLQKNKPFILKPLGGSHGAGVLKVTKQNKRYEIIGRDLKNKKLHHTFPDEITLLQWVHHMIRQRNYIIQQYVDFVTTDKHPYDIRILVQKNQTGVWKTIGMAVRMGDISSVTSNLHGGGKVESVVKLVRREFGKNKADEILSKVNTIANTLPPFIESLHGPLFELGLDIGIDRQGKVWIIEVNSKPGRKVFALLGDREKRLQSMVQPILYTKYLANRTGGKAV